MILLHNHHPKNQEKDRESKTNTITKLMREITKGGFDKIKVWKYNSAAIMVFFLSSINQKVFLRLIIVFHSTLDNEIVP